MNTEETNVDPSDDSEGGGLMNLLKRETFNEEDLDKLTDKEKETLYKLVARNTLDGKRAKANKKPADYEAKRKKRRKAERSSRKKNRK